MSTASELMDSTDTEAARALKIIEGLPCFAWSADPDGRFTYVTPNTLAYLGDGRDDLNAPEGEDEFGWRRFVHPDDYDQVAARWRHCLRTGDHYDSEHRLRGADGVYRWFRNSGRPARDGEGRIAAWYGTTTDIDEQKQAEAALRDRESELSQLVDMVPSHLWRLTPAGEPTFFNKRMTDFLGFGIEDTDRPGSSRLEAVIAATVHPDDAAMFRDALGRSLETAEPFSLRYRLKRADGVYHWMSSRAIPVRDGEGRIVQWYGLCHDIDDMVTAQEALRRSERHLQRLIGALPVSVMSWTTAGELTFASSRYLDELGLSKPTFAELSEAAHGTVHPDDAPEVRRRATECIRNGVAFSMQYRRRGKDGTYRWLDGRFEPLRDPDGSISEWFAISIDIDDVVRVQEALRERERFLWQLVETLPAMIDCAAPDGEPVYRSQQLREFLGYDLDQLDESGVRSRLTGTLDAGVHPDDLAGVKAIYARSLATGEPYARRHRLRRHDGSYRWVETRAAPMRGEDGAIVQWNVICLDIDGEVRAQEQLRLAHESLARASQAASLAELSASIAHEVNQPLAAVVANSHACQRWLTATPPNLARAEKTVERIIRDANSAADVVSRIRALFRQSTGARAPVSLGAIVAEARELMADEAARRRVVMDVTVEDGLPAVPLDRIQVQQVLINLVRNGFEAMDGVAGPRSLAIRVRRNGDFVETEVADRGSGIPAPEKIFEPFFSTKEHGMGMGLAICRSIVESHGGRLWAANNDPEGAVFAFTLPIEAAAP